MATITFGEEKRAVNDRKRFCFQALRGGTFDKEDQGKKKKPTPIQ